MEKKYYKSIMGEVIPMTQAEIDDWIARGSRNAGIDGHGRMICYTASDDAEHYRAAAIFSAEAPARAKAQIRTNLSNTDVWMSRVAEDIMSALMGRGLVTSADFSKELIEKVADRSAMRELLK